MEEGGVQKGAETGTQSKGDSKTPLSDQHNDDNVGTSQSDQEFAASHESSEAEREEESGSVSAMGEKDKDTGKSKVNKPTTMPMVEKPEAFSFSQFATGNLSDHELVKKTTRSSVPVESHPLLKFP